MSFKSLQIFLFSLFIIPFANFFYFLIIIRNVDFLNPAISLKTLINHYEHVLHCIIIVSELNSIHGRVNLPSVIWNYYY